MQPDQIILPVDVLNNGTAVNLTMTRYEESVNKSVYISPTHVPELRDTLGLYRTQPTKSGNFKGVAKSALKLTKDVLVAGVDSTTTLTAPMIIDVSFSIPVGAVEADVEELRQRVIAALDNSVLMRGLNTQLMV